MHRGSGGRRKGREADACQLNHVRGVDGHQVGIRHTEPSRIEEIDVRDMSVAGAVIVGGQHMRGVSASKTAGEVHVASYSNQGCRHLIRVGKHTVQQD